MSVLVAAVECDFDRALAVDCDFDLVAAFDRPLVGARCTCDANIGGTKRATERIIATVERVENTLIPPQKMLI